MEINSTKSSLFCGNSNLLQKKEATSENSYSDIKLFKIELSKYHHITDVLLSVLSPLEVKRAQRYHHLKDTNRFIICRALLKILIAKEKGLAVSQIYFEKETNHKPYFPIDRALFFNVSHAGDFAIIAIGNCELGVDVEQVDEHFNYSDILSTVFSAEEISFIKDFEFERRLFYKFWTRKEAIVKAIGKGIDDDFSKIPVADGNHEVPTSLVQDFKNINVYSLELQADYFVAIAYTQENKTFDFYPIPQADELLVLLRNWGV
ncbi:4'-phosphopantetheinyl transferase family protein [Winogradskyella sp. PC D3.3]